MQSIDEDESWRKKAMRGVAHMMFGTRRFTNRKMKQVGLELSGGRVLEIGSGKEIGGEYPYSQRRFFDGVDEFVMSDVVPEFGHRIVDVTDIDDEGEWDVILCANVLEHVKNPFGAVDNLHDALVEGGELMVVVPTFYPLHDEPEDYWRFTEHGLREILSEFHNVRVEHSGPRVYPFSYFVRAEK